MNMTRLTAISLLVATELSVELTADLIQYGVPLLWKSLPFVFEITLCLAMMTSIIVAIALLDPNAIERKLISSWTLLFGLTKKFIMRVKRKDKPTV